MDYIAVIAVVALVLTVGAAAFAGPSIANGVGRGFQRAFCLVTGEGCATVDARPCTVTSSGTDVKATAKVTFVKVGRSAGILRTTSSDGTLQLTLVEHAEAGLTSGLGASGHLQLAGIDLSGSALTSASVIARLGGGRTWTVADERAADRLQKRLIEVAAGHAGSSVIPGAGLVQKLIKRGSGRKLPRPTSETITGSVSASASVQGPFGLSITDTAGIGLGTTKNLKDGSRSVALDLSASTSATLASEVLGGNAGLARGVQVTFDRHGRATELQLNGSSTLSGVLSGEHARPAALKGLKQLSASEARGQQVGYSATLDLTVPAHLAAVKRLLRALVPGHGGDRTAAAAALGQAVANGGRLNMTRYGTREQEYGGGAEAALGPKLGVDVSVNRSDRVLKDALTRPPGGVWERQLDCLRHA